MARTPNPVNPAHSPWDLLGALIRHLRERRGLTQEQLADLMRTDVAGLSRWERAKRNPPSGAVELLDRALAADGILTELRSVAAELERLRGKVGTNTAVQNEVMDAIRRQLLGGLLTFGATHPLTGLIEGLDNLRGLVDDGGGSSRLDYWAELTWEYGHTVHTCPSPSVIADLAQDILGLQRHLQAAPAHEAPGWYEVNARMTFFLAYALGSLGQARESRHWWASARNAAERADSPQILAAVHGFEGLQALYEGRPLAIAEDRIARSIAASDGHIYAGTVESLGGLAQIHILKGDVQGAHEALNRQAAVFERLPDSITSNLASREGWPESRLLHNRSMVLTMTGHPEAETAQREALHALPPERPGPAAQIKLHGAIRAIRGGDIVGGLQHAQQILNGLPEHGQTRYVHHIAGKVLDAVPPAEAARPPAIEYRQQLAIMAKEGT